MISRAIWKRAASTAAALKVRPKAEAATVNNASMNSAATGKMPPQRPVLTPLQRRASPFEALSGSIALNESRLFPAQFSLPAAPLQNKLSKNLKTAAELFGGNYLVWRGELMSQLAGFYTQNPKFVLEGSRGTGKSALLLQIFASLQQTDDALLLMAPDAGKWTTGYFAYYPTATPGVYEQPELALEILNLLVLSNPGKELPVRVEEIKEASKDPLALALPLFTRVFAELKASGRKLTLLVDDCNGLLDGSSATGYHDVDGRVLPLSAFPLCRDFVNLGDRFIGALTHSNPLLPKQSVTSLPRFTVPKYSDSELKSVLQMYRKLGHGTSSAPLDDRFVAMKAFLSGRNGRLLFKSCEYEAIYQ